MANNKSLSLKNNSAPASGRIKTQASVSAKHVDKGNPPNQRALLFAGVLLVGLSYIFYNSISGISPFIVGFILAYFLVPAVDKLASYKINRTIGTTIVILLFVFSLIFIFVNLVPILIKQLMILSDKISAQKGVIYDFTNKVVSFFDILDPNIADRIKQAISSFSSEIINFFVKVVYGVINSGKAAINLISLVIITPIVLFYFMRDWNNMSKTTDKLIPRKYHSKTAQLISEINQTLSGYVRGQTAVCFTLGAFYAIALASLGIESGVAIGFISGLLTVIPYAGAIFSCLFCSLISILQFGFTMKPVYVVLVFLVGQVLEGYIIVPKMIGDKVNLHPVWIMFGLIVGGSLFGFIGILIALPLTAVIGVVIRFAFREYQRSSFYK